MQLSQKWVMVFRITTVAAFLVVCYFAFTPQAFKGAHIAHIDKVYHLITFAVLFFLLDYSFPHSNINWKKITPLIIFALGIEVVQSRLPYRDFSLYDFGADLAGMGLYLLFIPVLRRLPLLRERWV